ncbi:glycosyltransferase [Paenibacillus ihbetae]|uniref:Glycosyltransferase 2-like domain-containing protein n=1 Tax=Paenibacillus ihbetae TaxID=1870820 RepID=A0ABX3K2V0_9BACL|nr:glycosyltransferase [Paenibacillus ihbetae]OOC63746.1 hypothetical protein BBD40_18940 [Paenibacillus ihbetae]
MGKQSISLCMIVKNEERCLERCLNSVQGIVDEIIIVDTGSTDKTLEIAKRYTDKIYFFEWINDFAQARNFALEHATGDYILHLDADEYLYKGSELLKHDLDKAYYFLRIRNDLGFGQAEIHQFVRLFQNSPTLKYEGALHEQINLEKNAHLPFGFLNCLIYHDGYLEQIVKDKNKDQRNMDIAKAALKANPTPFNYYNLGMQYAFEGEHVKAIENFKQSYSLANNQTYTPRLLILLMKSLFELKQYKEALDIGFDSVLIFPGNTDIWYLMGSIYDNLDYFEDAKYCYNKCLEIGEGASINEFNHNEGSGSYLAYGKLSRLYLQQGNKEKAQEYFILAAKEAPDLLYLVKLFTDLHPSLSGKEFLAAMLKVWPFTDGKWIQNMMTLLYEFRHPAAYEIIKCYHVELPLEVEAWVDIIEGNYDLAIEKWNQMDKLQDYFKRDPLLLAFITQNFNVLSPFKHDFGFREREWKWWRDLIQNRTDSGLELSKESEECWINLCADLMKLQKYENLEELINSTRSPKLRLFIAEELKRNGFTELALQIVVESNSHKVNERIYSLVSDILKEENEMDDAIYYANMARSLNKNFINSYRLYNLLKLSGLVREADQLIKEMKIDSIRSPWLDSFNV